MKIGGDNPSNTSEVIDGNVCCDRGFPVAIDQDGIVIGDDERHNLGQGDVFLAANGLPGFLNLCLEFSQVVMFL